MENREGTLMWVGALAIACLGYFYKQKREERQSYIKSKERLAQKCLEIIKKNNKIDFQQIKRSGKKEAVFFPEVRDYTLEKDTYTRFVRHHSNMDYYGRQLGHIREDETGGRFNFKDTVNQQNIVAEINNCKIQEFVLTERRERNIIFQGNKNKIAESSNLTFKIGAGQGLALFGVIGYSITQQKFIFQPEFIVGSRESSEAVLQKLSNFWQQKIQKAAFYKVLLGFSIVAVSYIFIYHPLKSMWKRYRNKFEEISKEKLKYFAENTEISARTSSNLNCEICKNNTVNIIYQCGHLCVCQKCNAEENKDQKCPICMKVSTKSIKIFL